MKNLLIIYPHFPPSNLAGVHRSRLIANYLHNFDFQAIILTVKSEFYEEKLDPDMLKTVSQNIEIHYTKAFKIKKPRIIGDIGLRAFPFLKKEALKIIKQKKIDFIWIPIPAFYTAVLGRILYKKTKIPYGIDYIDPWIRDVSRNKTFRAKFSIVLAKILEPFAVKKASLISGVAEEYFNPVLKRNFKNKNIETLAMPYGFDTNDHKIKIENINYPWENIENCKPIVYAGAFLPKSDFFMKLLFSSVKNLINKQLWNKNIHLFFLGTGYYPHKSIKKYAEEYNISEYVHEIKDRFSFLHILNFLSNSYGNMIIGSTEKHYTASKTFQTLLGEKPVFSIFHEKSTAVEILKEVKASNYTVEYSEKKTKENLKKEIENVFLDFIKQNHIWKPNLNKLDKYSAKKSAFMLAKSVNKIITNQK